MSLKAVHIAFITVATLFSAFFGVWALLAGGGGMNLLLAIVGLAGAVALPIYGAWFLKKMKKVGYV